jgi:hypothetical protein
MDEDNRVEFVQLVPYWLEGGIPEQPANHMKYGQTSG